MATEGPLVAMSKFEFNEISVRKLQFQFVGIVNNHPLISVNNASVLSIWKTGKWISTMFWFKPS